MAEVSSTENGGVGGGEEESRSSTQSPVRASAFRPGATILAPSRLGSNPFVSRQGAGNFVDVSLNSNPFAAKTNPTSVATENSDKEGSGSSRMILKPSALDRQTANLGKNTGTPLGGSASYKSSFKLEPAKLKSPFSQPKSDHKENITVFDKSEADTAKQGDSESKSSSDVPPDNVSSSECKDTDEEASKAEKEGAENFVFGQNMEHRVTDTFGQARSFVFGENVGDRVSGVSATGTAENDKEKPAESTAQTLVESAAAHQAKQTRPELQEVHVTTGEENESNVFQVNAKLFSFDKATQSWLERGRGLLRLNDMTENNESAFQSRLVMRTSGSLRVILNTKVWSGMTVERVSPKSVRVTAAESDGEIKIFLIMTNPKDADQIVSAIDWRVQQLKKTDSEATTRSTLAETSTEDDCQLRVQPEKRPSNTTDIGGAPAKKAKVDTDQRRDVPTDESSGSSSIDPETEVSNESFTSKNKSSSSE